MKLTDKLDLLLKNRGLNRRQFSEQSGIPYMTVVNFYEKGTENVKLSTLKKIASFFGVSLDYIADDDIENIKNSPEPENSVSEEEELQSLIVDLTELFRKHGYLEDSGDISDDTLHLMKALADFLDSYFSAE